MECFGRNQALTSRFSGAQNDMGESGVGHGLRLSVQPRFAKAEPCSFFVAFYSSG